VDPSELPTSRLPQPCLCRSDRDDYRVNGVFATITFGSLSGSVSELRRSRSAVGPETWVFLVTAFAALCGSIGLATACLRSRLDWQAVVEKLRGADDRFELIALTRLP
jgi:hypothetical protein